jgi:hypothetical protein
MMGFANYCSQNTQLAQLNISAADQITIANNRFARNVSVGLNNVTTSLTIESNNPDMTLDLPSLYWANNITFRNLSTLNMPLINTVNNSLGVFGCTLKTLQIPNLGAVKGGLSVVGNSKLTNIQLPGLLQIGGLQIANNSNLDTVSLDQLGVISGNSNISGTVNKYVNLNRQRIDTVEILALICHQCIYADSPIRNRQLQHQPVR